MHKKKIRLDQLLVSNGLACSLSEAKAMIMAGNVSGPHSRLDKAGMMVPVDLAVYVKQNKSFSWVSRGGVKLSAGIAHFGFMVHGAYCLDIGSSTGGFTDVLLHHGASRVYAVDVGYGELDWRLRNDKRVVVCERVNARSIDCHLVPDPINALVCDVSFTTLQAVLPASFACLAKQAWGIFLVKPQFQVHKREVTEGGIITDPVLHQRVCTEVSAWLNTQTGWSVVNIIESPILGAEGNKEFLLGARYERIND
jgi:23S rRNA (cytidine1920-2'-O)/16S rRNA (cytidine1409-2'-O)-methyltransferase